MREPDDGHALGRARRCGSATWRRATRPSRRDRTPIEFVRDIKPMYEEDAVALLGRFLFRYDQMRQPVGTLSRRRADAPRSSAC